jgi:hypothetical protein
MGAIFGIIIITFSLAILIIYIFLATKKKDFSDKNTLLVQIDYNNLTAKVKNIDSQAKSFFHFIHHKNISNKK